MNLKTNSILDHAGILLAACACALTVGVLTANSYNCSDAIAAGVGYFDAAKKFHWRTNQEFAERPPVDAIQLYAEKLDRMIDTYNRFFDVNQLQFSDIQTKLDRVLNTPPPAYPIRPPTLEYIVPQNLIRTNTLELNGWYIQDGTNIIQLGISR